jgi:hypothetical protein
MKHCAGGFAGWWLISAENACANKLPVNSICLVNSVENEEDVDTDDDLTHRYPIHNLKVGSGAPNISNIKNVAARLSLLQDNNLPKLSDSHLAR